MGLRGLSAVGALALALAGPVGGQLPDTTRYGAVAVSAHPRGTVVSAVVRIPTGSEADPQDMEGSAWMLGELLAHRATELVGPEASVTVEVGRSETRYTLLALPEVWQEAWARLESVLFEEPLTDDDVEEHRRGVLDALGFDAGSPVRSFQLESARVVAPPSHPWARPITGTPESIQRLTTAALGRFRDGHYRAAATAVAVVGAEGAIPDGQGLATGSRARMESPEAPRTPAWQIESQAELVQDITNTWIAVAWPVAPDVERTSLEFLANLLQADLDPVPPDPDRYGVDVRLVDAPGGVVLLVEAAVFPEAADRWEARILQSRERLARTRMDEDFLGWRRRRFRTARLLVEAAPEAEAARLAADLAREGTVRDLGLEIWRMDGDRLLAAARALGPPRILRLGPDLGENGSRN